MKQKKDPTNIKPSVKPARKVTKTARPLSKGSKTERPIGGRPKAKVTAKPGSPNSSPEKTSRSSRVATVSTKEAAKTIANTSSPKKKASVKGKKPPAPRRKKGGWMLRLFFFFITLLIIPVVTLLLTYYHYTQDLPSIESLKSYRPKTVSYVYADDGQMIGEFSVEHRLVVPLEKIPQHVILAFVAAEDSNYFNHPGLDLIGITRAFMANIKAGRIVQGGSTITQQVTRSFLLSNEKTYDRKIREALLAYRIEQNLNKEQILHLYLNQIYLGHGAYGVESAALFYFNKHTTDLTLAEAALIAGLTRAPSRYSPFNDPSLAKKRQIYVLNRMLDAEFISPKRALEALKAPLEYKERPREFLDKAPYFTEHIRRMIEAMYGPDRLYFDGLRVYTTVNVEMQAVARKAVMDGLVELTRRQGYRYPLKKMAEKEIPEYMTVDIRDDVASGKAVEAVITKVDTKGRILEVYAGDRYGIIDYQNLAWSLRGRRMDHVFSRGDVVPVKAIFSNKDKESDEKPDDQPTDSQVQRFTLEPPPGAQGAFVCMETGTGHVKAMIGGYDWHLSQFNRAVQARRQPGSAFKPFVYAAAIDNGFTQASNVNDIPVTYQDMGGVWAPRNYGGSHGGPTTLYSGLVRSVNVVAVRLLEMVGAEKVIEYAHKMGIKSPLGPNLSLALGTSEVTLLEMVGAFTTFPNLGERVEPIFITRIEDRDGKVITEFGPQRIRALSPETAYIVLDMMRGVVQRGTGARVAALGRPVAGKTGTTQDHADAWFIGYTPDYAAGAWVGRDKRVTLGRGEQGGRTAAPIFLSFMKEILKDKPVRNFTRPLGVVYSSLATSATDDEGDHSETYGYYCFKKGEVGAGRRSESMPPPEEPEEFEMPGYATAQGVPMPRSNLGQILRFNMMKKETSRLNHNRIDQ